jgi:hypothetical protein
MDTATLISQIDAEIAKLQLARQALVAISTTGIPAKRRGRPAKNATPVPVPVSVPKKRTMSAEARARIAAAEKERWATHKRIAKKTA